MSITVNGTEITSVSADFNGMKRTILGIKYDGVGIYAYESSLYIYVYSSDNATASVYRTSSPYKGASSGTLTSGSKIYYGDTLRVTITPKSGYTLTSFKAGGYTYTSSPVTVSVASSFSVSDVKTTASSTGSWKTVYTGSSTATTTNTSATNVVLSPTISIPSSATKIRVTGTYKNKSTSSVSFTNTEITLSSSSTTYTFATYVKLVISKGYSLQANLTGSGPFGASSSITITKLEAYY